MFSASQHIDFVLPILVSQNSPRQNYVFDLIFNDLIGIDYELYENTPPEKFLSYGSSLGEISVYAHGYLYAENVEKPVFDETTLGGHTYPFATTHTYDFCFDLFSTIFYFVSRHEEYGVKSLDKHGRFRAEDSWLTINGWLKNPIINHIAELLRVEINRVFSIKLPLKDNYKVIPTIDIDNPYAFYGRPTLFPSIAKSCLTFDFSLAKQKIRAKRDKSKDPFDTHDKIINYISTKGFDPHVFFLMKSGNNNSINSIETIKEVIKDYGKSTVSIGIHPSYNSKYITDELTDLEQILGKEITRSRFHYILSILPKSYQSLISSKIKEDYSMGYANVNGFRAGICNSFYWFDLTKNEQTDLRVTPFCFMDATFIFNLKTSASKALKEMNQLIETVQKYKGELSFVFHNESLSDQGIYNGWGANWNKVFEKLK